MKKFILLLFCVAGLLSLHAQDVITIQMKDGSTVEAPVSTWQRMDYTTDISGASMILSEKYTVQCLPDFVIPKDYSREDSLKFFTFNMSDELRSAFTGFESMRLTNKATGASMPVYTHVFDQNNQPVPVISIDGYLHPYLANLSFSFMDATVNLAGAEPIAHAIEIELTAKFRKGDVTFTQKAVCQFSFTPETPEIEDTYYIITNYNQWLPTPLTHTGSNKYDGQPFTAMFVAPQQNGQRADCELYVVPASGVEGSSFDPSKTLGVADGTTHVSNNTGKFYSLTYSGLMAAGAEAIKLPASDGAELYEIRFYPTQNFVSIEASQYATLLRQCYTSLGFGNLEHEANRGSDIPSLDTGMTSMIRQLVNLNELTTDELLCCWGDPGITDLNFNSWSSANPQLLGIYLRLQKGVEYCNRFLACPPDDSQSVAEVRFLRAYYNYYLLDLFGNVPLFRSVTDKDPATIMRNELFGYIEQELLACVENLAQPHVHSSASPEDYGRVDQAAAWMLLARLYLNAEVYTGLARWTDAAVFAGKVADSPYSLYTTAQNGWTAYQQLFMGDNGENGAAREAIMVVPYDGITDTDWGTQYLVSAPLSFDMTSTDGGDFGTHDCWAGVFARPDLVNKFFPNGNAPHASTAQMVQAAGDDRALLWGQDRSVMAASPTEFTGGFSLAKFSNRYATGGTPHHEQFMDTDIFLMRYAEALLTLAETDARMNNGVTTAKGTTCINQLRTRAHAATKDSYQLQDVLDEWTREFYLEGRHRTDLVRFGLYGGHTGYQWCWKGGNYLGTAFPEYRNIFPLPQSVVNSSTNIQQNPGY